MNLEKEAMIDVDWLTVKKYQFKILVMIACLAENHLAFRGKLKDMCDFLGIESCSKNRNTVKEAINALVEKGDLKVLQEGQTWTLTLSVKAEKKQKIIKIKNAYIQAIRNYEPLDKENDSVGWENILKVLVYLCADKREVIRYKDIGTALGFSKDTAERAVRALVNIDFGDMCVKKKLAWLKENDNDYKVIGNRYEVGLMF